MQVAGPNAYLIVNGPADAPEEVWINTILGGGLPVSR